MSVIVVGVELSAGVSARAGAPLAVNGAKQTIAEILAGEDESAAKARIQQAWASEDMKEGLAAIREKRPPNFKGV